MKKNIYVVSRCLKKRDDGYQFHFIGYFNGHRIKSIEVFGGQFELGEDYLLILDGVYHEGGQLYGDLIRSKKVFT